MESLENISYKTIDFMTDLTKEKIEKKLERTTGQTVALVFGYILVIFGAVILIPTILMPIFLVPIIIALIMIGVGAMLLWIGYRTKIPIPGKSIQSVNRLSFNRHDILESTNWSRRKYIVDKDNTYYLKISNWGKFLAIDTLHLLIRKKLEDLGFVIVEDVAPDENVVRDSIRSKVYSIEAGIKAEKTFKKYLTEIFILEEITGMESGNKADLMFPILSDIAITVSSRYYAKKYLDISENFQQINDYIAELINKLNAEEVDVSLITIEKTSSLKQENKHV
ncbi:MAG: phage holin family protein [Candidatus Helarchaeota archaeon]